MSLITRAGAAWHPIAGFAAAACTVQLGLKQLWNFPIETCPGRLLSSSVSNAPSLPEDVSDGKARSLLDRILQDETLGKWAAVTRSLQSCLQHVGPWSLGDLAFGLRALAEQHVRDSVEDAVEGQLITDRSFVERLLEEVWIAEAVHQKSADAMARLCCLERSDILTFDAEADHFKTAFALAVWPSRKQVVLVVRGTTSLADALTDLTGHLEPFDGTAASAFLNEDSRGSRSSSDGERGTDSAAAASSSDGSAGSRPEDHCHHGIAKAAMALLDGQAEAIARALKKHPGYSLKLLGHSLGAGTAAIAAMLIRNSPEVAERIGTSDVTCVAFAPPPVVTHHLAVSCSSYVQSVVHRHDVVPRASLASFERLRQEMLATRWEDRIQSELKSNRAVELAIKARSSLDETLNEVGIRESSEKASQALASAWAGARAAIQSRLGVDPSESATLGAAVGAGVNSARSATEAAAVDTDGDSSGHSSGSGRGGGESAIPHLYAPGELLYLCCERGSNGREPRLLRADPASQRFSRIVLCSDMVSHHRATSYIRAIESVAQGMGIHLPRPLKP